MNSNRLLPIIRRFSTTARKAAQEVQVEPGYLKVKEKQKMYQIDNGLRIHERGGTTDKILYNLTTALIIGGAYFWLENFYIMAFPKK